MAGVSGFRSLVGHQVAGMGVPPPSAGGGGYISFWARWLGGMGVPGAAKAPAKKVGWMPEWRFRHDPEELERRLKAQRESAFSPHWLDRFLKAEEKARARIGHAKTAKHRAALEQAVEQAAARVSEAIDAGYAAPSELIIELEAAALAHRATSSIKHAEHTVTLAASYAEWRDEDEIEMLLLN